MPSEPPPRDFYFLPIPNAPTNPPPLVLSNSSTWTYCGPLLTLTNPQTATTTTTTTPTTTPAPFATPLPATFHSWTAQTLNRSLLPHLTPFLRAAHTFLTQHGVRHYWLTVRAAQPPPATASDGGAPPPSPPPSPLRWHTAADFFANPDLDLDLEDLDFGGGGVYQWKLSAALQGPGMLFAEDGVKAREVLRGGEGGVGAGGLGEGVKVVQAGAGEMVFMRVGAEEGAVVAEPRVDRDCVFVSVVPGTEAGFRGVLGRYGMEEFPRSWSFGVPGWLDAGADDHVEGAEDEGVSMERY